MCVPYGAIEGFDCERVAILLPTSVYAEGEYPEAIVAHHIDGLKATPVRLGITYVPQDKLKALKAENKELRESEKQNAKLRDYAYALEECKRAAYYCEICPHCNFNFEDEEPRCDFDFDALRAAAGMEKEQA